MKGQLRSNDSNEMNSFKLLSVKIYNIKELLVLSLVSFEAENIYKKKAEVRNTSKASEIKKYINHD